MKMQVQPKNKFFGPAKFGTLSRSANSPEVQVVGERVHENMERQILNRLKLGNIKLFLTGCRCGNTHDIAVVVMLIRSFLQIQ